MISVCVNHRTAAGVCNSTTSATNCFRHFYCTRHLSIRGNFNSFHFESVVVGSEGGAEGGKKNTAWVILFCVCFFGVSFLSQLSGFYSYRIQMTPPGTRRLLNPKECALWTVQKKKKRSLQLKERSWKQNMPTAMIFALFWVWGKCCTDCCATFTQNGVRGSQGRGWRASKKAPCDGKKGIV